MKKSANRVTRQIANGRPRMRRRPQVASAGKSYWGVRYAAFLSIVVLGCWLLDWSSAFELLIVLLTILCVWVISISSPGRRRKRSKRKPIPTTRSGSVVRGVSAGIVTVLVLCVITWVSTALPAYARFADRDRSVLENQVELLMHGENYVDAAELVRQRLQSELSAEWQSELEQQHVELLTLAGQTALERKLAVRHLESAIDFGERYGVNAEVARSLLELEKSKTEAERSRDSALQSQRQFLKDSIESLQKDRQFAGLDALLRNQIHAVRKELWPENLLQVRYYNLIDWGDSLTDVDERGKCYEQAVNLASKCGMDGRLALARMGELKRDRSLRPTTLPVGTVGTLRWVETEEDGRTLMELTIEHGGKHVGKLRKNDFQLVNEATEITDFDVMEADRSEAQSVSVLLAVDQSESTAGYRKNIHDVTARLVESSPKAVQFRVMTFAEEPAFVTPWTRDESVVRKGLQASTEGVKTGLRPSVLAAVRELQRRDGRRVIVLMSDGVHTFGSTGLRNDDLVSLCRAARVHVIGLGIEHHASNTAVLKRLASGSGGLYLPSQSQADLIKKFGSIRTSLTEPVYWIRVHETKPIRGAIQIKVGSGVTALHLVAWPKSAS